jgi:hypothetical protein
MAVKVKSMYTLFKDLAQEKYDKTTEDYQNGHISNAEYLDYVDKWLEIAKQTGER